MGHVPQPGHSRRTHGRVARKSHSHSGYLAPLQGAQALVDQEVIDGVIGPGDVPPGTLDGDAVLVPASLTISKFLDDLRPVAIVDTLPTLPDTSYPVGSAVVLTTDGKIYRNVADAWTNEVDGADLVADSVQAGAISAGAIGTTELAVGARLTGEVENDLTTPTVVIDSTGIQISDGALTFFDEFGATALDGGGFGASWRRFIQSGVYNADFEALPPTPGSNLSGSNQLPAWTFTQASGTAIVARSVADTSLASGRRIRFTVSAGAAGDLSYIEQIIPVVSGALGWVSYAVGVSWKSGSSVLPAGLSKYGKADWLDSTGALVLADSFSNISSPDPNTVAGFITNLGKPPVNARFLRIRVGVQRTGATSLTGEISVCDLVVVPSPGLIVLSDSTDQVSFPTDGAIVQEFGRLALKSNWDGSETEIRIGNAESTSGVQAVLKDGDFLISRPFDAGASLLRVGGAGGNALEVSDGVVDTNDSLIRGGGASFPSSPATNDLFYRTDRNMWFFWDGTQWLSTNLFAHQFQPQVGFFTVTSNDQQRIATPHSPWDGSIYVVDVEAQVFIASGGTALSASHKWVAEFNRETAGSAKGVRATMELASGASDDSWKHLRADLGEVISHSSYPLLVWDYVKTGTPGNTVWLPSMTYRLVG